MSDYRIVCNDQTGRYRLERRRWWGWSFEMDADGEHYLTFTRLDEAQRALCERLATQRAARHRRWRVIGCCQPGGGAG